ncbi:hypothetical protein D3C71_1711560 [compost metagenome]
MPLHDHYGENRLHAHDGRHHPGRDFKVQGQQIENLIRPQQHHAGDHRIQHRFAALGQLQLEQRHQQHQAAQGDDETEHQEGKGRRVGQPPFGEDRPAAPQQNEQARGRRRERGVFRKDKHEYHL